MAQLLNNNSQNFWYGMLHPQQTRTQMPNITPIDWLNKNILSPLAQAAQYPQNQTAQSQQQPQQAQQPQQPQQQTQQSQQPAQQGQQQGSTNQAGTVYAKEGRQQISSGMDRVGGNELSLLLAGGLHTLGGLGTAKLAQALAPDTSKSVTESQLHLLNNLSQLSPYFQHNQLGDVGLAAAVRAQQAYQRNLLTPEAVSNLAQAQQSAQQLQSLAAANAARVLGDIQNERRAMMQTLLRSGANPAVLAGAMQRAAVEQGARGRELVGQATQQAMEGLARAQAIRDQALQNLMQQQQLTYATKVVPTLNQFDTQSALQAAVTPMTIAESRSQNYVLPSNPLDAFAQAIVNTYARRQFAGDASDLTRAGVEGTPQYSFRR